MAANSRTNHLRVRDQSRHNHHHRRTHLHLNPINCKESMSRSLTAFENYSEQNETTDVDDADRCVVNDYANINSLSRARSESFLACVKRHHASGLLDGCDMCGGSDGGGGKLSSAGDGTGTSVSMEDVSCQIMNGEVIVHQAERSVERRKHLESSPLSGKSIHSTRFCPDIEYIDSEL